MHNIHQPNFAPVNTEVNEFRPYLGGGALFGGSAIKIALRITHRIQL